MVNRIFRALHTLPPPVTVLGQCVLCGDAGQIGLDMCSPCVADLPTLGPCCPRCAIPLTDKSPDYCGQCLLIPPPFLRTVAAWHYRAPIAQLISGFKYNSHYSYGHTLAKIMTTRLVSAYIKQPFPDLVTAIPLHWTRRLKRGFNQSEQLARHYAKVLDITTAPTVKRCKATAPQQSLDALQRQQNLRGAFSAIADVTGRRIALVDDVMTTGATASEVSRCLLEAGAMEVHIWCLARTPL